MANAKGVCAGNKTLLIRADKRKRRKGQSGSILTYLLFVFVGIAIVGTAIIRLADTASRISHKSEQKTQATALAEAAIQQLWAQNCSSMNSSGTYSTSLSSTTLTSTVNSTTTSAGSYYATAVVTSTTAIDSSHNAYVFQLDGYGTSSGTAVAGATSHLRAYLSGTQTLASGSSSGTGLALGNGAIQASGKINLVSNGGLRIEEAGPGRNEADVIANGGIGWQLYSGTRSQANGNVIDIQGQPMTPAAGYSFTTSTTTGLFIQKSNGNSSSIFTSIADPGVVSANQVEQMSAPASFPSATQVATWQAAWLSASRGTGSTSYSSTISFNNGGGSQDASLRNSQTGEYRITAPAYINGDLTVNSGQLYLQPNSDSTKSNVVYVTGKITNGALLYNRGVMVITVGGYTESSQSAQYGLQMQSSPYNTGSVGSGTGQENQNNSGWNNASSGWPALFEHTAIVSLATGNTAITLYTNSSGPAGLLYAANGGMTIYGNNELDGALIAGNGDVNVNPNNGNSFVVWYHDEAINGRTDFQKASTTTYNAFNTTKAPLSSWTQMQ